MILNDIPHFFTGNIQLYGEGLKFVYDENSYIKEVNMSVTQLPIENMFSKTGRSYY